MLFVNRIATMDQDTPLAPWKSTMYPYQRRCRHPKNGKAGNPANLRWFGWMDVVKPEEQNTFWPKNPFVHQNKKSLYITSYNNSFCQKETITSFSFLTNNVQDRVYQLSSFGVVPLRLSRRVCWVLVPLAWSKSCSRSRVKNHKCLTFLVVFYWFLLFSPKDSLSLIFSLV